MNTRITFFVSVCVALIPGTVCGQVFSGDIAYTPTPPVLDGMDDDAVWGRATPFEDFEVCCGDPPDGPGDAFAIWKALWDDDNLYAHVSVIDDTIVKEDSNNWQDDSIEFYIDATLQGFIGKAFFDGTQNAWTLFDSADQDLQNVVQVVDGKWRLTSDRVRTERSYYDRVLSMGDEHWRDYEATIRATLHGFTPPQSRSTYLHRDPHGRGPSLARSHRRQPATEPPLVSVGGSRRVSDSSEPVAVPVARAARPKTAHLRRLSPEDRIESTLKNQGASGHTTVRQYTLPVQALDGKRIRTVGVGS